ncbi:TetR/AcrR family transcriptional regulator [Mycolicibacterium boenickei]|uniref:TetR/AcrR family transcriptional regulator n=1 Tax=Mycobacterium sp. DL99 TaxID=2528957 RepID=UPI0010817D8E|nr:TetR/AcrR family transcriptional regulator [Mycobacterium sp. DL99]QRY48054.1 TetR/AcrR family transcriptional regulator [Mycolicibacterium boenickei]
MTDKPKQVRGVAVRERFVDVATALFYTHGVRAVGIDEIVRQTGMAKASLYRWFPTKDDLILAVLERRDENFWAAWDHTAAAHPDPRNELDAQIAWIQDLATSENYRGCAFLNTAAEFDDTEHHAIRTRCLQHEEELHRRLRGLTSRLKVNNSDELADRLHIVIVGSLSVAGLYPKGSPASRLRSLVDDLLAAAVVTTSN